LKRYFHEQNLDLDDEALHIVVVQPAFLQESIENGEIVNQALSSLAPRQRHVIEMLHFAGHTLREISEMERQDLTGIRNSYYRGLKTLRTFLGRGAQQGKKIVQRKGEEEYEIEL
jgi:RNA polymerase sigma factor (sigma-70 family)